MDISHSRSVVTGGASGLGLSAVERLVAGGSRVAIFDLPTSPGEEQADRLGDQVMFVPVDVTDTEAVAGAVAQVAEAFGGIDVNVNCAGIAPASRLIGRDGDPFPLDLFTAVVSVNLIGTFDVLRRCAVVMADNEPGVDGERGVIVNVASVAAYEGQIGQAAYSASKGGIVGMMLPIARDLASRGIRVNTVAPGIMETPLLAGASDEVKASLAAVSVFPKRLGLPEDFSALVIHLVENVFINGETVRLDAAGRLGPR
ncbi:MAG: SDR family NAD(P)-dependent oxidoreductase [Acidimicrobiia bacterium]|nr:SDR family NAD(P)-dependent oxidoreductase [Acidimicrobiia bacterium]NNF69612.1 SDR family NAD(P)-dependent oxidoreductase [Acidimicrobiia bacterium]